VPTSPLPRLSVVVPVYQAADVLPLTVPAMLAQDLAADWIFVDDGSTDGSVEVLEALLDRLEPVASDTTTRIVRHPANTGRAAARNTGRAYAHGDVIVFLDVDMAPARDFLRAHARMYRRSEVIGAVSPERWADLDPSDPYHLYLQRYPRGAARVGPSRPVPFGTFIIGYTSMRRQALDAVGGFDEGIPYGEDIDLAYRLDRKYRGGLWLARDAEVVQHGAPRLAEALAKWKRFGLVSVPLLLDRHPSLAPVIGADLAEARSLKGLFGVLALHEPASRFVQRLLSRLPQRLRVLAVRYLVAASIVEGIREAEQEQEPAFV
jgi:glycosyltransferase involved in cell wall biosynthesis